MCPGVASGPAFTSAGLPGSRYVSANVMTVTPNSVGTTSTNRLTRYQVIAMGSDLHCHSFQMAQVRPCADTRKLSDSKGLTPSGAPLRAFEVEVAIAGVPALFETGQVGGADAGPALVPEQAPDRVVDQYLLRIARGRRTLVGVGLVHVVVDQLVQLRVRVERQVRELGLRVEQERQVVEGIVDPRLPGLDGQRVAALDGHLPERRVRLLHDVDLEAELLQLALQPDRRLLVRGPAHANREVDGDRRLVHSRLLHERLGLGDVVLVRRVVAE